MSVPETPYEQVRKLRDQARQPGLTPDQIADLIEGAFWEGNELGQRQAKEWKP